MATTVLMPIVLLQLPNGPDLLVRDGDGDVVGEEVAKTNACTMVVAKRPVTVSVVRKDMSNGLPSSAISYKKSITSMSYKF
jgi:hypothetical protein